MQPTTSELGKPAFIEMFVFDPTSHRRQDEVANSFLLEDAFCQAYNVIATIISSRNPFKTVRYYHTDGTPLSNWTCFQPEFLKNPDFIKRLYNISMSLIESVCVTSYTEETKGQDSHRPEASRHTVEVKFRDHILIRENDETVHSVDRINYIVKTRSESVVEQAKFGWKLILSR